MRLQRAQNQSIALNKNLLIEDNKGALPLMEMGVSSLNILDELLKSSFSTMGLEVDKTYEIAELLKIFNEKNIHIKSIRGIKSPGRINPDSVDIMSQEDFDLRVFRKAIYETKEDVDSFCSIVGIIHERFRISTMKIVPNHVFSLESFNNKTSYTVVIGGYPEGKDELEVVMVLGLS